MRYVLIAVVFGVALFWMTEDAYEHGYLQGYRDGQERALMAPASMETCTKWWFDGDAGRARQAMNQYCERNKK
jgi:hypothetical protein